MKDKNTWIVVAVVAATIGLFLYLWNKTKASTVTPPVNEGGTGGVGASNDASNAADAALAAAQAAAEAAKTQAAADTANAAAAANAAAQVVASAAAADAIKAKAAADAQAAADKAAAAFEATMAQQLSDVDAATASAKAACDVALACFNSALVDLQNQQASIDALYAAAAGGSKCVWLYKGANLSGPNNNWGLVAEPTFNGMSVGNDNVTSFQLKRGFTLIAYRGENFSDFMSIWHADGTVDLVVNDLGFTDFGDNKMRSCKTQACPSAFAAQIGSYQDKVNQIKINLVNCKSALNLCIEREQSIADNIQTYNILSGRISTVSGSLIALRGYVAKIPV